MCQDSNAVQLKQYQRSWKNTHFQHEGISILISGLNWSVETVKFWGNFFCAGQPPYLKVSIKHITIPKYILLKNKI
jgi:hypothetical protein